MKIGLSSGWLALSSLALAAAACSGTAKEIDASNYNQSCSKDDDCMTVLVGDPCKCSCNTAAIVKSEEDEYKKDMDGLKVSCSREAAACAPCGKDLAPAICHAGTCEVKNQLSQ